MLDMTNRNYTDPDSFITLGENALFPCSTQFMRYDPLLHRYFLTAEGLANYGVDVKRDWVSNSPNKIREFIELISKKIYDTVFYKAGMRNYQIMMYRIATAPKTIYPDQYNMRKMFESALADQARYMIKSGDSAAYSRYNIEKDTGAALKPEEVNRDLNDIAPEALRTLETLGLLRWFHIGQFNYVDADKY